MMGLFGAIRVVDDVTIYTLTKPVMKILGVNGCVSRVFDLSEMAIAKEEYQEIRRVSYWLECREFNDIPLYVLASDPPEHSMGVSGCSDLDSAIERFLDRIT